VRLPFAIKSLAGLGAMLLFLGGFLGVQAVDYLGRLGKRMVDPVALKSIASELGAGAVGLNPYLGLKDRGGLVCFLEEARAEKQVLFLRLDLEDPKEYFDENRFLEQACENVLVGSGSQPQFARLSSVKERDKQELADGSGKLILRFQLLTVKGLADKQYAGLVACLRRGRYFYLAQVSQPADRSYDKDAALGLVKGLFGLPN